MTPEIQKFIDLLESQLGYAEKGGAHTKFGEWYGKNVEFDADYSSAPWCDMYLSWAAHKLGYEEWIGQFAWTVAHAKWFKEQGAWGKTPKPGAFVFYDWSGTNKIDNIDHVGIVTRVEGDTIYTIEGNIDGGVAKRKERDTSKVVGYGYPERIKSRLDEAAQKKAEEQASVQGDYGDQQDARTEPGGDVGRLQLPESLSSMIPQQDAAHAPLASRTEPSQPPRTGSGPASATKSGTGAKTTKKAPDAAATPSATGSPAGKTAGKAAKTGKHAKPTTAGTTAATGEPLPSHVDASAGSPLPNVSTPTLIGSALVAALALLAVAKTRRSRTAPVAAERTAPRPARSTANRRRRRRPATAVTAGTAQLRTLTEPMATVADAIQPLSATQSLSTSDAVQAMGAAQAVGGGLPRRAKRSLDTRPFDLATDAASRHSASRHSASRHATGSRAGRGTGQNTAPFTPAFDTGPFEPDFDRSRYEFTDETGTFEIVLDTGPLERVVDTSPFERIVIPAATSEFDAFAPARRSSGDILDAPGISATYQGRRRRYERPAEEITAYPADLPSRGRRHRRPAARTAQTPQHDYAMSPAQDVPLRGRRHRAATLPAYRNDRELVGATSARGGRHRA
ncbi:hypothetical protein GCM10022419_123180 [Nonomuraea rosea]|uniref:Peptidase C51 domain-containing protein n=1 Tax=Nonomuraea rosea TaxID=638574 RepID=A0ABP6ZRS6_9ACTN